MTAYSINRDGRELICSTKTKLVAPRRSVKPSVGDLRMSCSNCGGQSFRPHVRQVRGGSARVVELVCDNSRGGGCQKVFKLDLAGCLEEGGKRTEGPTHKELIDKEASCLTHNLHLPS